MTWDEIKHLKKILKNTVISRIRYDGDNVIKQDHRNNKSLLSENGTNATLRTVDVVLQSNDGLTLKGDVFGVSIFEFAANKGCDYILLCKCDQQKYAIFIELKSSITEKAANASYVQHANDGEGEYVEQMNSSLAMFEYLSSVVENFYSCTEFKNSYQKKLILLYGKKVPDEKLSYIALTHPLPAGVNLKRKRVSVLQVPSNMQIPIADIIACAG